MAPSTQKQWRVQGTGSFDNLKYNDQAPVPQVGDNDVLVKFKGASLNYRDLTIAKGFYPFAQKDNVVPASDGSGVVEAVGSKVQRFKPGDKVLTIFNQAHLSGPVDNFSTLTGTGGVIDGTLQQYGVYNELGLVAMPTNLNFLEAASLTCAGVTAWNALFGLKRLMPGEWVLTQGTGGVSIFALQFAKAAGARVIATTSSQSKADKLKSLGADYVLNYKEDANWGETAKKITGGVGVDHVIEVGGPVSFKQSLNAIKLEGVLSIIGFLGGFKGEDQPTYLDALSNICTVRGVYVGSRDQFEEMNRAIEASNIHPVIDQKVFKLEEAKDAYQYMWDQKHFGKLCLSIE